MKGMLKATLYHQPSPALGRERGRVVWGDYTSLKWEILDKEIEPDNADMRKGNLLQNIEMAVLTDDIVSIGNNGAVHKLVVVRVALNQIEMELRIKLSAIWTLQNSIDNVLCNIGSGQLTKNLQIFADNLVADTDDIAAFTESISRRTERTMNGNHLHKALGIDDNVTHWLPFSVWCAIVGSPEIFQGLLIPSSVRPKLFHCLISPLGKELRDGMFQSPYIGISSNPSHCIEQLNLCRSKGCRRSN